MLTDLILTILHHLAMVGLIAALVVEITLVKPEITPDQTATLARVDSVYGMLAIVLLAAGFGRVFFGLKGAEFYLSNYVFWTKIGLFVMVGLLSIPPTVSILRWRRALNDNPNFRPVTADIRKARRVMHLEAALLLLIPVFAAMLGRGYGA